MKRVIVFALLIVVSLAAAASATIDCSSFTLDDCTNHYPCVINNDTRQDGTRTNGTPSCVYHTTIYDPDSLCAQNQNPPSSKRCDPAGHCHWDVDTNRCAVGDPLSCGEMVDKQSCEQTAFKHRYALTHQDGLCFWGIDSMCHRQSLTVHAASTACDQNTEPLSLGICTACPAGTTSAGGTSVCTACPRGQTSASGRPCTLKMSCFTLLQ
jgi:hypothetical protein